MSTKAIGVRIWGQDVGAVAADPGLDAYVFEYEPAWRRRGIELSPLLLPVTSAQTTFVFPGLAPSFQRLPGLLADALPDKFGNSLIDAWMARRGVSKDSITALDRLAYMGKRALGAQASANRLAPFSEILGRLNRLISRFLRANPNRAVHGQHEDLPIADLPCFRGADNRRHGFFRDVVTQHDLDFDLGEKIHGILAASIDLGVAFLTSETFHLCDRHSFDPQFRKGVLHFFQLKRLDNGFDFLHF